MALEKDGNGEIGQKSQNGQNRAAGDKRGYQQQSFYAGLPPFQTLPAFWAAPFSFFKVPFQGL
jgi:hypothetical protein